MTLTFTLSWDPQNYPSWVILCWANICRIIQVQMYCKCIHISHHTSSGVTVLKAITGRSVPPSTYKLSGIIQPITPNQQWRNPGCHFPHIKRPLNSILSSVEKYQVRVHPNHSDEATPHYQVALRNSTQLRSQMEIAGDRLKQKISEHNQEFQSLVY